MPFLIQNNEGVVANDGEVRVMKKSIQAIVLGLGLSFLAGCEGFVKVDQNEDGSVQFSLVSSVTPCTTEAGTTECSHTTPSTGNTDDDDDVAVEEPTTETPADDEVVVEEPTTEPAYAGYVEWSPASFFEDGTSMTSNEIAHYEVVYGANASTMNQKLTVAVSGLNTFELNQLPSGNWVVGVKTVSIYGTASDLSNTVQVSI